MYQRSPRDSERNISHPPPSGPRGLSHALWLRRPSALLLTGWAFWHAASFPVGSHWLVVGLLAYLLLLLRIPAAWLVALPTLLPVLDLMPWSGRLYLNGFDSFVAVSIASGLWQRQRWLGSLGLSPAQWLLVAAYAAAQAAFTAAGAWPLRAPDPGALSSYWSQLNGLRLAKGAFSGMLLVPMLGQARARGEATGKWLAAGMLCGLAAVAASIVWERLHFAGLMNFDTAYRVSGLFSGMHTGGAAIDVFIAMSLPFVIATVLFWRTPWLAGLGVLLTGLGAYSILVTYSRANYPALMLMVFVLGLGWLRLTRRGHAPRRRLALWLGAPAAILATALVLVMSGDYVRARFEGTMEDLGRRWDHGIHVLSLMSERGHSHLWGMGKGRYPHTYLWDQIRNSEPPSTYQYRQQAGEGYLRYGRSGKSGTLDLRQRFSVDKAGTYQLQVRLRSPSGKALRLLVEFCQRNVLLPDSECPWVGINTAEPHDQWQTHSRRIALQPAQAHWYGSPPREISVLSRGLKAPLDIDSVQLFDPSGHALLHNPDFGQTLDHWYFGHGDHLAWHIKNIWVEAYFEGGIIGLVLLLALVSAALLRLLRRIADEDAEALPLLAALTATLALGMFDSVVDDPRIALLFILLLGASLLRAQPLPVASVPGTSRLAPLLSRLAGAYRRLPRRLRYALILSLSLVAAMLAFEGLQRHYRQSAEQLLVRTMERLSLDRSWLMDLVTRAERNRAQALPAVKVPGHPRIVLPALRSWSGTGRPAVMVRREQRWEADGVDAFSACRGRSLGALAACWIDTGDREQGQRLAEALSRFSLSLPKAYGDYGNAWMLALAYNLARTYPALEHQTRARAEHQLERALRHSLLLLDGESASLWHGRATIASMAWLCAIALDPGDPVHAAMTRRAYAHFADVLDALSTTEAWPEGYNYWVNSRGFLLALAAAALVNGLEPSAASTAVRELAGRVGLWHVYVTRPDNRAEGLGDEGPRVGLEEETRPIVDLLAGISASPVLATYSRYLAGLHGARSYFRGDRWLFRLINDPGVRPLGEGDLRSFDAHLPLAALFGPGAMNQAYVRSGWGGDATFLSFRAGDSFTHHGHYDAGHFSLFKGAPLAVNSSSYGGFTTENRLNYSIRSVAKNTILVLRPDERVPVRGPPADGIADGGQRLTLPTGSAIRSLSHWHANLGDGLHLEGGRLRHFAHAAPSFTYLAADITAAYNTPAHDEGGTGGKVLEAIRELAYLYKEDVVLVRDRVTSTKPGYTKKWLLHSINRPRAEGLRVLRGSPEDGILQTDVASVLVENPPGALLVQRLLPEHALIRLVGGPTHRYYVESDGDDSDLDGQNFSAGASLKPWFEPAAWRMEIQPRVDTKRVDFLVALSPALQGEQHTHAELLTVAGGAAHGVLTGESISLFVAGSPGGRLSFSVPSGARNLYVLGLPPSTSATLRLEGLSTAQSAPELEGAAQFVFEGEAIGDRSATLTW